MKKIIVFATVVLYISSCNKAIENNISQINVDVNEIKFCKISDFASSVSYIITETNDSCLISKIDKIQIYNNHFYIFDNCCPSGRNDLYRFSANGQFRHKIGKEGKGPGEYLQIGDFIIQDDTLIISDIPTNRLLYYSSDGKYLYQTYHEGYLLHRFIKHNEFWILHTNSILPEEYSRLQNQSEDGKITVDLVKEAEIFAFWFTKNFKTIDYIFLKTKFKYQFSYKKPYYIFRDKVHLHGNLNDTVYVFENDTIYPKYRINFGEHKIPFDLLEKYEANLGVELAKENSNYAGIPDYFYECEKYIGFSYSFRGRQIGCLYDKKNTKSFNQNNLENDINGGPVFSPTSERTTWLTVTPNNEILGYILAEDFIAHCEKNKDKISAEVNEIYKKLTPYSNPVLMKIKLK